MKKIEKKIICLFVAIFLAGAFGADFVYSNQTIKEKDEAAKTKYQEAWGQYQKEVNFFKASRENFLSARTKLQKVKNADNTRDLGEKTKSFLGKSISALIKKLEALKNWVLNKRALEESDRQAIASEIDKDIAWLNDRATKAGTATSEEIKEEAKVIRQYWKKHRIWMKKITGQIWAARVNFVIKKAEDFAAKLSVKTQELKAAGKETAQIEAWLLEFSGKIVSAKEKYEAAKAKFAEIKAEPGPDFENELKAADELFKAGHGFIKEANRYIKEAHAKLRQIVNEMKKAGKSEEVPTE